MVNSLTDFLWGILWEMAANYKKYFVHWAWYEGLPIATGLVIGAMLGWKTLMAFEDIGRWYAPITALAVFNLAGWGSGGLLVLIQMGFQRLIHKPNLFKSWSEEPPIPDDLFTDNNID
jgi:hypothetical protein